MTDGRLRRSSLPRHLPTAVYIYVASLSVTQRVELEVLWWLFYKNSAEGYDWLGQEKAKTMLLGCDLELKDEGLMSEFAEASLM